MPNLKVIFFVLFSNFVIYVSSSCPENTTLDEDYLYKKTRTVNCGCDVSPCIRKCCREGFHLTKKYCIKDNFTKPFQVPIYKDGDTFLEYKTFDNYLAGVMNCSFYLLRKNEKEDIFLQDDYRLYKSPSDTTFEPENFCLDHFSHQNFSGLAALICFPEEKVELKRVQQIGILISIPFLFLTLVAHFLIQDRNLHMNALMCYVFNLMMSYILLVSIELSTQISPPWWCTLLGHASLFFFISSIFWMNIICFDIFLTFSGRRGFNGIGNRDSKRFFFYTLYATFAPSLLILIIYLINTFGDVTKMYHPGIGEQQCFLQDGLPYLLYFHGPMALLLVINTAFFVLTSIKIRTVKQETNVLKKGDNRSTSDTKMFHLYMKLLLAMGINWIMETVSWAVEKYTKLPKEIWAVTDFCNAIYGLFIFIIFVVLNNNTRKILKQRWYSFTGRPQLAHAMSSSQQTTRVTSSSVSDAPTNGELYHLTTRE